jgi:hypothetical protein
MSEHHTFKQLLAAYANDARLPAPLTADEWQDAAFLLRNAYEVVYTHCLWTSALVKLELTVPPGSVIGTSDLAYPDYAEFWAKDPTDEANRHSNYRLKSSLGADNYTVETAPSSTLWAMLRYPLPFRFADSETMPTAPVKEGDVVYSTSTGQQYEALVNGAATNALGDAQAWRQWGILKFLLEPTKLLALANRRAAHTHEHGQAARFEERAERLLSNAARTQLWNPYADAH